MFEDEFEDEEDEGISATIGSSILTMPPPERWRRESWDGSGELLKGLER